MPDLSKLKIPTFKRDLIALWKDHGPGWMLAALAVVTIPVCLVSGAIFLKYLAEFVKVMR